MHVCTIPVHVYLVLYFKYELLLVPLILISLSSPPLFSKYYQALQYLTPGNSVFQLEFIVYV